MLPFRMFLVWQWLYQLECTAHNFIFSWKLIYGKYKYIMKDSGLLSFHLIFLVFLRVFKFLIPCCDVRYDFRIKLMFCSSLPPFVLGGSCLIYVISVGLCIVVSNAYCAVFLFVFVLCLVYPMLPVSLDCPFLIAPLVFSNVYWSNSIPQNALFVLTINKVSFSFVDTVIDNTLNWFL